jgi:hypothetical protein
MVSDRGLPFNLEKSEFRLGLHENLRECKKINISEVWYPPRYKELKLKINSGSIERLKD